MRYAMKNTIDLQTVHEQNDHEYVIGTVLMFYLFYVWNIL